MPTTFGSEIDVHPGAPDRVVPLDSKTSHPRGTTRLDQKNRPSGMDQQRLCAPCEPPTSRNVERETGPHLTGMHRRISPGAFADRRAALFSGSQTHAKVFDDRPARQYAHATARAAQACRPASVEKWIPSESPEGIFFWNTRETHLTGGPPPASRLPGPPSDQGMSAVFAYCLEPIETDPPPRKSSIVE